MERKTKMKVKEGAEDIALLLLYCRCYAAAAAAAATSCCFQPLLLLLRECQWISDHNTANFAT